jgi:hexosaminidase
MAFPRGAALAEVAWSSPDRDLADFQRRLATHLHRLAALGVNYRRK